MEEWQVRRAVADGIRDAEGGCGCVGCLMWAVMILVVLAVLGVIF